MPAATRVLLLGHGEMGHAMEHLLGARHTLQVWTRRPESGHASIALEQAVAAAGCVIYCVPVTPLAELAERVRAHLPAGCLSLSVAKGLDAQGRPAPRILADVYRGEHAFGVLYGPMIAEEIRAGRPAFAQVGVSSDGIYPRVAALFADSALSLVQSSDLYGIAWASVLKNVYAMLFGAADALSLGDNVRGYLAVAALAELQAIVTCMGGRPDSALHLAGLGDLVTTATSAGSHHRELGMRLVRGESALQGEGIHTLAMLRRCGLIEETAFPLFRLVRRLVEQPAQGVTEIRDCLRHPPLHSAP